MSYPSHPRRTRLKSHSDPRPTTTTTTTTATSTPPSPGSDSTSTTATTARPRSSSSSNTITPTKVRNRSVSSSSFHNHNTQQPRRRASSTTTAAAFPSGPFLFRPPVVRPLNSNSAVTTTTTTTTTTTANVGPPPPYTPFPLATKSRSSTHISHQNISSATFLVQYAHPPPPLMRPAAQGACSDSESEPDHPNDEDENNVIYTTKQQPAGHGAAAAAAFRSRILPRHSKSKGITTAPGQHGAGETETEADEPPKHLPTARIVPLSGPLVPPNTLEQLITPLLFEASRLLSIVPAVFGVLYNLFKAWYAPINGKNAPVDYAVSALWAALTGYQCLCLTTGLFQRWKVYYPPLSTLIRLLALQAICWPATHFSLTLIGHEKRPVICWAAIGSFTCCSRAVQLWVTSNLWWETSSGGESWRLKLGGRWGGRRWDWTEVMIKCGVPMGACYFAMAWAEALRRELGGC